MAYQNVRIDFKHSDGFHQILVSEGCHNLVQQIADDIESKANANYGGDGFVARTMVGNYGGGRWIGFVSATDKNASAAESEDKALTRALT